MTSTDRAVAPIRLWEGVAPGSAGWTHDEQSMSSADGAVERVRNVVVPTMTGVPARRADRSCRAGAAGRCDALPLDGERGQRGGDVPPRPRSPNVRREVPLGADAAGRCRLGRGARQRLRLRASTAMMRTAVPLAVADAERATTMVPRARLYPRHDVGIFRRCVGHGGGDRRQARTRPTAAAFVYLPFFTDRPGVATKPSVFVATAADDPLGIDGSARGPLPRGGPPAARSSSTSSNEVVTGSACRRPACPATSGRSCSWPGCGRSETRSADQWKRDSRLCRIATAFRCRARSGRVRG